MYNNIENNEKFQFIYKKDPKLNSSTIIKNGEEETTYGNILEDFPIKKDSPISLLVYWDDVMQFTSLGLIEILNALYKTNAQVNIEHFFERPNSYSNGMNYVYKLFEKSLKKEEIDKVKREKYWQLLEISLRSSIFAGLTNINTFIDNIGFFFPYKFFNCDSLRIGLNKYFFNDKNPNGVKFYYGNEVTFNSILDNGLYNSIITPNITATYKYILDKDIKKIAIIGPDSHNGIDDELAKLMSKLENRPKPNYCSVSVYKEQVFL